MNNKTICFALVTLFVICNNVYGKKIKKNKRPKDQDDFTTIRPNVVAYSTFGFNDVSSYIPTSPEYSSIVSSNNQESSTRLYAPAFPSAGDTTGYSGNYGSQTFDGQNYGVGDDSNSQSGMSQYTSNSMNFLTGPNIATNGDQNEKTESEHSDTPVYGTKIRNKHRLNYNINNPESEISNSGYSNPSDDKYFSLPEAEHIQEKPVLSESNFNYHNTDSYQPNYTPQQETDIGGLHFPRVVDFTKLSNQYPTELDTNKLISDSMKHSNTQIAMAHSQISNDNANVFSNIKLVDNIPINIEHYNLKNTKETNDKKLLKPNTIFEPDFTNKHIAAHHKYSEPSIKHTDQKNYKPWGFGNYSNAYKDWKDSSSSSNVKSYAYSTDYGNMNFKYGVSEPKKPVNHDELLPASSNVVDFNSHQFPEKDYNTFKNVPEFNNEGDSLFKEKYKTSDDSNQLKKNPLNADPTTTSSHWGGIFKSTDYSSSFGDHPKKSFYNVNDDDVVTITKRPHKLFTKFSQNKPADLSPSHFRSQKLNKPTPDWTKDFLDNKFKSEEDLLGLRTRDTSHPSYIPTFKHSSKIIDHNEYDNFKQLVEKWKESYIKSKYKDARDNAEHWPEKPVHVPIPKPHSIEVPHPVIVPVPHPFPVRVPISRPVAVPVLQELTVPIEKPVPYPVYKNVPYPVEKLVPVPIEKEVAVPVEKPYPVHIPYVRPVFHHTMPVHEDSEYIEGDDYQRRPKFRKPSQYKKRQVYSSRNRTQRPSRATYQERNRSRWPDRRRPSSYTPENEYTRPYRHQHSAPYRHHDFDEDEYSRYGKYCRNC
ncbi:unnamed protein product [Arctia plantaginis]|uniref:Uncharacterized protein n=1 Tax=Arctia plantaginis TaxID=874455 RepID=A0A8S1AEE1_ARCPL|nr:unnamed protein product [Arctia plantaginis]